MPGILREENGAAFLEFFESEKMRPEVVCFLTELALASEDVQMGGQNFLKGGIRGV